MEPLVEVKELKKYFPVKKGFFRHTSGYIKAVDGVNFSIARGETFGLVGESGCGKTTVGKLVLRLMEADAGTILFEKNDLRKLSSAELRKKRKDFQIIFQDPYGSLNPKMNVEAILSEGMRKHKIVPSAQIRDCVKELLQTVGLHGEDMYKYPHEFSGGQRQRIVIARALAFKPKLIVCDEPVSALDVSVQAQILNLLCDLQKQRGISYLFIAHGMAAVKHISQRIGVMYLGMLVESANTDELFSDCMHPYTQALLSSIPVPDPFFHKKQIILEGEVPNPINPPEGCRFHPRCRYAQEKCRHDIPELIEHYKGHMVACHFPQCMTKEAL